MAILSPQDIADFVALTQEQIIGRGSWADISNDYQEFMFAKKFVQGGDGKGGDNEEGGDNLQWEVQVANEDNVGPLSIYHEDTPTSSDIMQTATTNWFMGTANYSYDTMLQAFQGDMNTIVKYIEPKINSMYNSVFNYMEKAMWGTPSSSSDVQTVKGIPHWVVKNSTAAFGFNGAAPTGFTTVANISPTTYSRWKNGTFTYTSYDEDTLFAKWREACVKSQFKAPHNFDNLLKGGKPDWSFPTTFTVWNEAVRRARATDEQVGNDFGMVGHMPMFQGVPIEYFPVLTDGSVADSTNPVYGINWKSIQWFWLKGKKMKPQEPRPVGNSHNAYTVHMDWVGNFRCLERRSNFVGYKV